MYNKNPYSEKICREVVEKFEESIKKKYGLFTINDFRKIYQWSNELHEHSTPRYRLISGVIPCASFYYLNKLLETSPSEIADIGCGMNFFKDILPGVTGIDGTGKWADVNDVFDDDFVRGHTNSFLCAFSIDALHFIPITDFHKRVMDFSNIITPNGRGYLAMNAARMIETTDKKVIRELFSTEVPASEQISDYIDQQIKMLPLKFLVIDNLIMEEYDDYVDGNIRLVFER